jgi:hypothetical protein
MLAFEKLPCAWINVWYSERDALKRLDSARRHRKPLDLKPGLPVLLFVGGCGIFGFNYCGEHVAHTATQYMVIIFVGSELLNVEWWGVGTLAYASSI